MTFNNISLKECAAHPLDEHYSLRVTDYDLKTLSSGFGYTNSTWIYILSVIYQSLLSVSQAWEVFAFFECKCVKFIFSLNVSTNIFKIILTSSITCMFVSSKQLFHVNPVAMVIY